MRQARNYLLILLWINALHTFAQDKQVSLDQIYSTALEKYPGGAERAAAIHAAQLEQNLIKSKQLPQANLQLQNSFGTLETSSGAFFPLPGVFNINGSGDQANIHTSFNTYGSVLADWEVFSFGKLNAVHQASSLKVQEAVSDRSIYELDLQSLITRLYLKILYNDVRLKWSQNNVLRIQEIYKISRVLATAGLTPGADTALASSAHLQLLSDEDLLRGKLKASKHQLTEFISMDLGQMDFSSDRLLTSDLVKITKQNRSKHPYLDKLSHQIEYQNIQQKIAERSKLPSVSLLAGLSSRGFSYAHDKRVDAWTNSFRNQTTNYLIGVGLTWNITGFYDKGLEKKRSAALERMAEASYQQQALRIDAGIRSADSYIAEQIKQVAKTKEGVKMAEEAYRLYRTRYESGLINLTELLQIQVLLQQAEEKQIEAYKGLWEQVIIQSELKADFSNLFLIF